MLRIKAAVWFLLDSWREAKKKVIWSVAPHPPILSIDMYKWEVNVEQRNRVTVARSWQVAFLQTLDSSFKCSSLALSGKGRGAVFLPCSASYLPVRESAIPAPPHLHGSYKLSCVQCLHLAKTLQQKIQFSHRICPPSKSNNPQSCTADQGCLNIPLTTSI